MPVSDHKPALGSLALRLIEDFDAPRVALAGIPSDDPEPITEYVLSEIRSGRYTAREVLHAGAPVGVLVYSLEGSTTWPELVIVATKCRPLPFSLRPALDALCERIGRELGARSLRFHTVRPGLVKDALTRGFHVAEIVLRKPLL